MKQIYLLIVALVVSINVKAITFDSDSFTFKTLTTSTVAVTASTAFEYSGALTVPTTVMYDGRTYTVTEIDRLAFKDCVGLTEITLPASVIYISQMAFDGCTALSKITMPGVKSIRDAAFQNTAIAEITFPESLTSMFNAVFCGCKKLKSVQIPSTLVNLGTNSPFIGCTSLTEINVSEENPNYKSINGVLYSKDGHKLIAFPCGLANGTIAEGTETIGYQSFKGNPFITDVHFPASVSDIEQYAFSDCLSLVEFTVSSENPYFDAEDGLLYHGNVLKLCPSGRTSAIVKDGTKEIGDKAFYECASLSSVSLPTSVYEIGSQAFGYCSALEAIELPQMVSIMKSNVFASCTSLQSIVIPDNVVTLTSNLFGGCTSLSNVTIGAGVTNIERSVFSRCSNILVINVKATVPPVVEVGSNGFVPENVYSVAQLNVPVGTLVEYKAETPWNNFGNITEIDFAGIDEISVDHSCDNYPKYDLNGRIIINPAHGQTYIQNGVKRVWNK